MADQSNKKTNQNIQDAFPQNKKVDSAVGGITPVIIDKKLETKAVVQNPAKKEVKDIVGSLVTGGKEKKSAKRIFIGFISFVLGLIGLAYAFILWSLMEGGLSNPLFEMLGMRPEELKLMLLTVTNSLFGAVSLIFVIATLVKFFQWMMTSSESVFRKTYLKRMGGYFAILSLIIAIWVGLYWLISRAEANPISKNSVESMIITSPLNVIGLTSPVSVKFDIGENLYKKIPAKFIRQIEWDLNNDEVFGDASGAIINHRFLGRGDNNGRFMIKAKVSYFSPSSNEEKTYIDQREVIISNEAVSSILTVNVDQGAIPLTVRFSAKESSDSDGNIIQYEWDFDGDGTYEVRGADKSEIEHIFTKIGDHNVSLRVTGQNNDYAVDSKIITAIAAEEKIRGEISSQNSAFEGVAPLIISLDGSQSYTKIGTIIKYEWFVKGENKSFIGRIMKRKFDVPGEYEVSLVVENQEGDRNEVKQTILVYEKRNVVIETSETKNEDGKISGTIPFEVSFDSSKSEIPRAVEWKWDFENDGIYDEFSAKTNHIFRKVGEHTVKLTIIDSENKEFSQTQKVLVSEAGVVVQISASPAAGEVPLSVEFDGSGSTASSGGIIDYIWEFKGEQPIHYGGKISREFRAVGVFPVKLTVLTSNGERATREIFISVRGKSIQASFEASPLVGDAPLDVAFNPQKSTGNIREYYWTFGDGKDSYLSSPKHVYKIPGTYIAKLKITDGRSLISEVEKKVIVTDPNREVVE